MGLPTPFRPPAARLFQLFIPGSGWSPSPLFLDCRVSQVPSRSFGARCLLPPRRALLSVSASFFSGGSGFVLYGGLTTLIATSRGRFEFACATAHTFVFRGFGSATCAVARSVDYMSLMLLYMANSFHLARTPKLRLAHHKRHPLRATPIYSVLTLSWLRFALKMLPSFAFDPLFARDRALRHQVQNFCHQIKLT